MNAAAAGRRRGPEGDADGDGMIWADLWVNIAFVLFAVVIDVPATLRLEDTVLLTEGTSEAPGAILALHLVADADGDPVLRQTGIDGPDLADEAVDDAVAQALQADPSTVVLLAAAADLPTGALLDAIARLERAGAPTITIARSVDEGDRP